MWWNYNSVILRFSTYKSTISSGHFSAHWSVCNRRPQNTKMANCQVSLHLISLFSKINKKEPSSTYTFYRFSLSLPISLCLFGSISLCLCLSVSLLLLGLLQYKPQVTLTLKLKSLAPDLPLQGITAESLQWEVFSHTPLVLTFTKSVTILLLKRCQHILVTRLKGAAKCEFALQEERHRNYMQEDYRVRWDPVSKMVFHW